MDYPRSIAIIGISASMALAFLAIQGKGLKEKNGKQLDSLEKDDCQQLDSLI